MAIRKLKRGPDSVEKLPYLGEVEFLQTGTPAPPTYLGIGSGISGPEAPWPFHPLTKKGQPFGTSFDYVGMYWDLAARTVGVREEKRRKFLFRADCFLAFFSTSYYPAVVSVASREEEQRKRALARRASDSAPPRTSLAHSSHVSASSSHASLLSSTSITATDSVTDSCNHDPPLSLSSASDVLTSRPSVGRTVIARGPRLAKDSHFIKSTLRPENVPAHMRIAHWITPWSLRQLDDMRLELPASAIRKVNEVLIQSWSQSTRTTQGAALLRFTEHCDELGISEDARMPASSYLLASFVAKHAGSVSESSIDGWMASLHAWHTVNNAPWKGDSKFVSQVKKGAVKLAPPPKPPRKPVTLEHMKVLQRGLNMFDPFDAAVWAVGTCAFWGCCRLGELTVEFDGFVDPKLSVLSEGVWHPMTKSKFLDRCNDIWTSAGLEELDGHAFRIGGSTELLLGGVPPHVVAMVGRWKSLTFLKYWRNVSEIIVNSISSCYDKSLTRNCSRFVNIDDVSIARSVVGWNGVPAQLDSVLVVSFALGWWFHGSSAAGNLWRSAFSSVYLSGRSGFGLNLLLSRERQFTKALGSSRPREIDLFASGGSSSVSSDPSGHISAGDQFLLATLTIHLACASFLVVSHHHVVVPRAPSPSTHLAVRNDGSARPHVELAGPAHAAPAAPAPPHLRACAPRTPASGLRVRFLPRPHLSIHSPRFSSATLSLCSSRPRHPTAPTAL
ncbi:hypothetical protein DFP72DRAFT_1045368 [Ephemerocybe angulata]|uniref:Uncharacterized protein n=1 Tax=Ephemerocybe angulata TaxID=980116 RepID=A0A8H6I095_9AGAR|nr:hypothetical protein DFP72DRAFT_1045368 [Tulosesus angulatus]